MSPTAVLLRPVRVEIGGDGGIRSVLKMTLTGTHLSRLAVASQGRGMVAHFHIHERDLEAARAVLLRPQSRGRAPVFDLGSSCG